MFKKNRAAIQANAVTLDDLKKAFPARKSLITQEAVDIINGSLQDPEFQGESLLECAVLYESVLSGKVRASIPEYLNALKFCAYIAVNDDNATEAYKRVFYFRDFVKNRMSFGTDAAAYKELTSAASRYRRSALVTSILTVSQVPFDMLFMGARYKATQVLAELMVTAKLDKDKIAAAKELLAATKGPDKMDIGLTVGPTAAAIDMQESLNAQLAALANNQRKMLEGGFNITEVQKTGINLNLIEEAEYVAN